MNSFKISKGHNIKLPGVPAELIKISDNPDIVNFHPSSIKNIKTKLMVKEGDDVKIGSPLFYDKNMVKIKLNIP